MREVRYPVYVISKGRARRCITARMLSQGGVPFTLVVEEQEADEYRAAGWGDHLAILPFRDLGAIPARNWCWEHAIEQGADRHWILDDNIQNMQRWHQGRRLAVDERFALSVMEEFTDRYTNIGISGPNYVMFATGHAAPIFLNVRVYSALLIRNDMPYRWRGTYNADTDLCLQVLTGGLCTVLFNALLIQKIRTMQMRGGNTERYQGDGRLRMARSLERVWPGIVETKRRYERPQHVIKGQSRMFDTPLIRRTDLDWDEIEKTEYDLATRLTGKPRMKRVNPPL